MPKILSASELHMLFLISRTLITKWGEKLFLKKIVKITYYMSI